MTQLQRMIDDQGGNVSSQQAPLKQVRFQMATEEGVNAGAPSPTFGTFGGQNQPQIPLPAGSNSGYAPIPLPSGISGGNTPIPNVFAEIQKIGPGDRPFDPYRQ